MKRCARSRAVLGALWLLALAGCGEAGGANIVLIVADDLGVGDVGAYGSDFETPHLDALAAGGVRFAQAYASAPICAPTRAGLLTGRDANRYDYARVTGGYRRQVKDDVGVATDEVLLSALLHDAGFATGAFGKWHLGVNPHYRPLARGFDEFFGVLAGTHAYFDWRAGYYGPVFRGNEPATGGDYLTTAITREALDFVARHRDRPFFLYVAYTAVHAPYEAPAEYLERVADIEPPGRRYVAAMLAALDDGVGALTAALREARLDERTLVVFASDNGGTPGASSNGPLRGGKGSLLEGGIRVPFIARWSGVLPEGEVFEAPVSTLDVFPTALAAAQVGAPAGRTLDGVDLLPWLTGEATGSPHAALFFRIGPQRAVRRGDLKLVRFREPLSADVRGEFALYDLAADPGETRDLAPKRPELAAALRDELARWEADLPVAGAPPRPAREAPTPPPAVRPDAADPRAIPD